MPLICPYRVYGAGDCYREFPRMSLLGSSQIDPVVNKNSAYESCTWRSLVSPCLWWKRNNLLTKAGCERRTPMVEVKLDVTVRPMRESDLSAADRILRLAF